MEYGARQRFDGAVQLYRARFSVYPYDITESALAEVVRTIQRWIISKEEKKPGHGKRPILQKLRSHKDSSEIERSFMSGGFSAPEAYVGGMSTTQGERLCVDAVIGDDGEPIY